MRKWIEKTLDISFGITNFILVGLTLIFHLLAEMLYLVIVGIVAIIISPIVGLREIFKRDEREKISTDIGY